MNVVAAGRRRHGLHRPGRGEPRRQHDGRASPRIDGVEHGRHHQDGRAVAHQGRWSARARRCWSTAGCTRFDDGEHRLHRRRGHRQADRQADAAGRHDHCGPARCTPTARSTPARPAPGTCSSRPTDGVKITHRMRLRPRTKRSTARRSFRTAGSICRRRRRCTAWASADAKPAADAASRAAPRRRRARPDRPARPGAGRAGRSAAQAGREAAVHRAAVQSPAASSLGETKADVHARRAGRDRQARHVHGRQRARAQRRRSSRPRSAS